MSVNTRMVNIRLRNAGVAFLGTALYTTPIIADDFAALARLAAAQGEQYVQQRDTLLKDHPERWNVRPASEESWEWGLAGFILNRRLQERDTFVALDNQLPRLRADLRCYELSTSHDANVAFLLEKMWKAPATQKKGEWIGTRGRESERAYGTLILLYGGEIARAGDTALWRSMWQNCEDEHFRYAAIYYVCADRDPSVQMVIEDVLKREDDRVAGYSAKARCLEGLRYRDVDASADAILDAWGRISEDKAWIEKALVALCSNGSDRARRFVHQFALDPKQEDSLRSHAVAGFCLRAHPGDAEVFQKFFETSGSVKMKTDALQWLHRCPFDQVRPVFREILIQSDDPKMIASAALALDSAYILAKEVDEAARAEDITLLEGVRTREGLTNATRVHIGMYIERLRGNPNPRLPDRPARDR